MKFLDIQAIADVVYEIKVEGLEINIDVTQAEDIVASQDWFDSGRIFISLYESLWSSFFLCY